MSARTETQAVETDVAPAAILAVLADPLRVPDWAPGFADSVAGDDVEGYVRTKDDETFALFVVTTPGAGTVDVLREIAPGETGGAYLRAMPRPGGGSVVTITVPVAPGVDRADVVAILRRELDAIVGLAASS